MRQQRRRTIITSMLQCRILVTIFVVLSVGLNVHLFMKHTEISHQSLQQSPPPQQQHVLSSSSSRIEAVSSDSSSSQQTTTLSLLFPDKPPRERFPNMDKCKVIFRDATMATCHMGAYGGTCNSNKDLSVFQTCSTWTND